LDTFPIFKLGFLGVYSKRAMKRKHMDTYLRAGLAKTSSKEVGNIIAHATAHPDAFAGRSGSAIKKDRLAAFHSMFDACFTEIDIPLIDGTSWGTPFADVGKMLACLASRDADWDATAQKIRTEERVATSFYDDEFTGGNVVALDPSRKVLIAYLHFNADVATAHDADMWLPVTCIRSRQLKTVAGGVSGFWFHILRQLYREPLQFCLGSSVVRKQLVLKNLLGDEAALKDTFNTKGRRPSFFSTFVMIFIL